MRARRVCKESNEGCLAPAGYRVGSGVADGDKSTRTTCVFCGEPVCTAPGCSKKVRDRRQLVRACVSCAAERNYERKHS